MSAPATRAKIRRGWVIRAAGSLLMLAILFWLLPFDHIRQAFEAIPLRVFLLVLLLFLLAHVAAALKWWLLLDRALPPLAAIRAHFAGLAANLCLPGAIGGDAVRAGLAQASVKDGARVVAVAAADRLIDMLALLAVSGVGLVLSRHAGADSGMVFQVALFLAVLVAGVIALPHLLPLPWRLAPSLPGRGFAERLAAAFSDLSQKPALLALAFVASTAIQCLLATLAWWLAVAAGTGVDIGHWLFAWPLAKIVAVLPVSLNGLGLREATLAVFLSPFGADPSVIVAAGLMWQAVLFVAGGLGGLVLSLSGLKLGSSPAGKKEYK
ncbi:lysylphosphatidylglycerol synthase transmembrane domain-containing protein [Ruegeria sp.]|uniref:lysylphosphatidylglycerol synthase transmembrane domain-containing protein n=1 Tax=Ruegeria sp. TaxID=1879320 RepID=UPI003B5C5588